MKIFPRSIRSLIGALFVVPCLIVPGLIVPGLIAASPSVADATTPSQALLALGDSLAVGYQPSNRNLPPPINELTGFADAGYPGSYPADIAASRNLQLTDLGCPGETTSSFLTTPAERACGVLYKNEFGVTSQMAAMHAYLDRHRRQVDLVTLDIGTNDIDRCISSSSVNFACALKAEITLQRNLATIIRDLKAALHVDDPAARILLMNYYDPFLGLTYRPGGTQGAKLAAASLVAVNAFNIQLGVTARTSNLSIANVSNIFKINSAFPLATYNGKRLPTNVVMTCRLTWMCPTKATIPQDIHPDLAGYRSIASAFNRLLPVVVMG